MSNSPNHPSDRDASDATEGKPSIQIVAAVIERNGRYLITQRRRTAVLPLLWEFPGGKVEPGEQHNAALKRELGERLDAQIEVGDLISFVTHPYPSYTVELYLYECKLLSDKIVCKAVNDFRWVTSAQFDEFEFTPADEASMNKLLGQN